MLLMLRCSWVQGQKKMVSSTDLASSAPGAPSGKMSWVLPTLMGSCLSLERPVPRHLAAGDGSTLDEKPEESDTQDPSAPTAVKAQSVSRRGVQSEVAPTRAWQRWP
ncbi:hypothetical protein GCM10027427_34060 [Pseudoclavibacter terrae]